MLLETIYIILFIILISLFSLWASAFFFGAPFQSSTNNELKKMIELSGIKSSGKKELKIADLGSGIGKVLIAFAKLNPNIKAYGYEINPLLVWISNCRIKSLGLQDRIFVKTKNFWNQDFSKFDLITSFQVGYAMPGLEKKFQKELKRGAKIVSNSWKLPRWQPKKTVKVGLTKVYLYVKD